MRRVVAQEEPTRLCSQINFPIKLHLSTTQEEKGGSFLQQLGKKWLFYQPEHRKALFHIVFLWMLGESEVAAWWRRKGGDKVRSYTQQNSVRLWLLIDRGQEGRNRPLARLTHSSGSGYIQELGPCLCISLPKFSRTKQALASLGTVHWYIRFHHQISSFQLHWCFMLFLLLQLTGKNSKKGHILLNWYPLVRAMLFKHDMLLACYFPFLGTSLIFTSLRRYFIHTQNKTGLCNYSFRSLSNPSPTT